ncbi:MAG: ATP-binding cassette domain-containing protein [Sphaerochaetaceae bacterium]|jgi:iron complex transport system ATP-binding protein|nr:ATP-binding cassette domain-containing protein [Sphaerochaetaceae bacterium]
MCGQPIISLQNITVRRAGRVTLDAVSLDIRAGEHVAIIGANGAGKSTLVQVMSEEVHPLWSPDSHRILFGSSRWQVLELRKRMGIVSAALQYLCTTSYPARHIVLSGYFSSIGLDFHHQVTEAMEEAAGKCLLQQGVLHLAEKPMRSLSSGEARRVLLARATVHDPQVMLLDEAVSNLDLPAKKSYRESLERFAHEGRTIILVTHDLSEIIGEIGRVVVLKQGRIIADGPKRDVLSEDLLSEAYGTRIFLSEREGRFNAWC